MYVKIVSRTTKESDGEGEAKYHFDLPNALIECDEVSWNRMTALSEAALQDAIHTEVLGNAPGIYEVFGVTPDVWTDYEYGEAFVMLGLISDGGKDTRHILTYEQSVYLMNNQGKTIERIC